MSKHSRYGRKTCIVLELSIFIVALLAWLAGSVKAQGATSLPAFNDLEAGVWTQLNPGGDTICALGTPYAFYARPAAVPGDKLVIHFQGGGACWLGENCSPQHAPTYDPQVDASDNPINFGGIFDLANPANPFGDYNMVVVSYCTADLHVGNIVTDYETDTGTVRIHHNGATNATTALSWVFENIQKPETVFVTGCSAGAIASPFYTQHIAEAYPNARIEQLGDAAGGLRNPELANLFFANWGTASILPEAYADIPINKLTFEQFYITSASLYPNISFSQYNAAYDDVQTYFLTLTGLQDGSLPELLQANFADINATVDNFNTFTAGGREHCVTNTPDFYTYRVNDVSLRDWVADLAAGNEVGNVSCEGDACKSAS